MPSIFLPEFSFAQRVVAETAKIDQLEIDIGDWVLAGDQNGIGSFIGFLGAYPGEAGLASYMSSWPEVEREYFGRLFNVPKGDASWYTRRLHFRGNGRGTGSMKAGVPLAQGYLSVKPIGTQSDDDGRRRMRFFAKLNPTRFVRHQINCWEDDRPPADWNWRTKFKTRAIPLMNSVYRGESEAALDGKDNVILTNRSLAFANTEAWPHHMLNYFECFHRTVQREFLRVTRIVWPDDEFRQHVTSGPSFFQPKKVEVYWEFASSDPIREVRRLASTFSALGDATYFTEYPVSLWNYSAEGNSVCVRVKLPQHLQMRIYAKTTERIRVEVVFDFKHDSIRKMVNEDDRSRIITSDLGELFGWFTRLYAKAAETFNLVFAELEQESEQSVSAMGIIDLVEAIYGTVSDQVCARRILRLLVENGRIATSRGSALVQEVAKLRRKGILRRRLGSDVVTARFRRALRRLRKIESAPHTP